MFSSLKNSIKLKVFIFYGNATIGNASLLSRFETTFRTDASYPSAATGVFHRQILVEATRNSSNSNEYVHLLGIFQTFVDLD